MASGLGKYNISSYVDDLIPDHIETSYPDLVAFIKVYALYLERHNNSGFYLNSLDIQRDIDFVEEHLLTELQNEIGVAVPRDFATEPRMFYKHLIEFYRSRGTPESITSFFRMIYNDEVETYFPFVDLLNPSDGDWYDQSADIIANQANYNPWNTIKISPTTAGSFTTGLKYKITVLTGTTQAQWNTAAGTSGVTYAIGTTFTAVAAGAGSGTASSNLVSGNNDEANALFFDDDIVFVNTTYQTPGTDYTEEVYSDTTTKYKLTFTNALTNNDVVKTYPKGLFTTVNGFLSDKKYIQDSYYYQKFSYVLKTGKNIANWKNAFTRLIHPAGFIFFGEVLIFIKLLTSANTYYQYGWLPLAGFIKATIYPPVGISNIINAGSFIKGVTYTIKTLGNTTQAQWLAAGVLPIAGEDAAAVGVTFIAATTGTGTGTVTGRTEPWTQQTGVFELNRIGKYTAKAGTWTYGHANAGKLVTSTIGYTNVEKTYTMPAHIMYDGRTPPVALPATGQSTGSGGDTNGKWDFGMWDHWENMKFRYLGPISNFASYTIQDGINNNIGIQHNQEVMKLTCGTGTLATINGEPYTSTSDKPYVVGGVHQTKTAGSFVVGDFYKIATVGNTDFTAVGSANNNVTVTAGAFVVGSSYEIVTIGNTTQAQWETAGVSSGTTAAAGIVFTAAAVGAGTGTASAIFKATGVGAGTGTTTRYTRYYLQDCTSAYG